MPVKLTVGDAVLVQYGGIDNEPQQGIGLIRFMGFIQGLGTKQYLGIELVDEIPQGHNGCISGYKYFEAKQGHGLHCKLSDVVSKLSSEEMIIKLTEVIQMFKVT